jgi:hypothetical protein
MKNTTIAIIFAILVVLLVNIGLYSAAAFVNWEWNPELWDAPTRLFLVFFSVPLSIGMGIATVSFINESEIHEDRN